MEIEQFNASLLDKAPPSHFPVPLQALWWDMKGNWEQAHALVDELETTEGMAVHAYLHRKEGADWNANYWYQRAGAAFCEVTLDAERAALITKLFSR